MTTTVEKKIVELGLENKQFEKGVDSTLDSVNKLNKALSFEGVGKGFDSISDGIQALSGKFSAFSIMGITALVNLTNSAINAGKRIAAALTIEPISTGFNEYEQKLNSVQTIMAGSGEDLQTVTKYLAELNEYADKTIYSFGDMTRNIGKFTNAGVNLDKSVKAIKGVANVAAVSGANAEEASRAMYNFAQALSKGYVQLIDWKSIELANMGTVEFKQQLIDSAVAAGTLTKELDGTYKTLKGNVLTATKGFNEALTDEWMTTDVLIDTLGRYTDTSTEIGKKATAAAQDVKTFTQLFSTLKESAQSGWAETWELIIGDFDEAKRFLTELNNFMGAIIGGMANSRNALFKGWKDLGGRNKMLDALANVLNAIIALISPIQKAFQDIFPPMTAQRLYDITNAIAEFTKRLVLSKENAIKIGRIFRGVFAILDIGRMAISAVVKALFGLSGGLSKPITSLIDFLALMGDYATMLRDNIKNSDFFTNAIVKIGDAIRPVIDWIKNLFDTIKTKIEGFKGLNFDSTNDFFKNLGKQFEPLQKIFTALGKVLDFVINLVKKLAPIAFQLGGAIAENVSGFMDKLTSALGNFEPERVIEIINGGLLAGILLAIRNFVNKGSGMFSGITGILDGVKDSLAAWQNTLKSKTLLQIAAAMGILALSVIALSMVDPQKLTAALTAMTVMFAQLGVSLAAFEKISSGIKPYEMTVMATGLIAVAAAMLIMSFAAKTLGQMSGKQLLKGIMALGALIVVVKIAAESLSQSSGQMIKGALSLIIFSVAIRSLALAVGKLGEMDLDALAKGLVGVGVIIAELAVFMRVTDLGGMGILKSVGILILAGAIGILAIAVSQMGKMDTGSIVKGLAAMGGILTELGVFIALTGGAPTLILTAGGVLIISASMFILAQAMKEMGALSWEEIAKGLTAMAISLTLIGAAAYLIPPTLALQAVGLVIMAAGLVIIAKALQMMGGMSWDEIARGLVALGGSLLILTVALMAMSGTLMGSVALIVAAGALAILAPVLKSLGKMSLQEVGIGLLALAGAFAVLGLAGLLLTPVVPTLLGLGAAMLLIGAGAFLAGVGILALSVGLTALAAGASAIVAGLVIIVSGVAGLIPMLVQTLGRAILAIIDVLVKGAPTLLTGLVTFLNILLDGLIQILPKLVSVIMMLIDQLLGGIAERLPDIIASGYTIIKAFLSGFAENIGDIVTIVYDIITKFIDAVAANIGNVIDSGWNLIISWINGMRDAVKEHMPELIVAVNELAWAIIQGLVEGLISGNKTAREGIIAVANTIIDAFKETLGINSPSTIFWNLALNIIQGLANGIKDNISIAITKAKELALSVLDTVRNSIGDVVQIGIDFVTGFATGISNSIGSAIDAASNLAGSVIEKVKNVLDSNSPSKVMIGIGGDVPSGMAIGIDEKAKLAVNSAKSLADNTVSVFSTVASSIMDALNTNMDLAPTITPVVDLSTVQTSADKMQTMFKTPVLDLTSAINSASRVQTQQQVIPDAQQQTVGKETNINFTQINNSPKALSRIDIYRQTQNQLMRAKGVLSPR